MKVVKEKGIYGEGNVYILESLEDFAEYEELLKKQDPNFLKWNSNFYEFRKDFEKYIGKLYKENDTLYKIIALEDNDPMADWYWVCQNPDDPRDIIYVNGLDHIEDGIQS